MNMPAMRLFIPLLIMIPLAACDARTKVSSVDEQFTITKVKPPKRLYVDVADSEGRSYHVYVAKRCSNWRSIVVGSKVTLQRNTYRYESGKTETAVSVRSPSDVCPR